MNSPARSIIDAQTIAQLAAIRDLFREYAGSLDIDLCFHGFEEELAQLPGRYAPPEGRLLLLLNNGAPAGCVALRKIAEGICEMKRLYVRPAFRRHGSGRILAQAIIEAGRQIGYQRMRLDTLPSMAEALTLYRSLGFQPIPSYYANSGPCTLFMELVLA